MNLYIFLKGLIGFTISGFSHDPMVWKPWRGSTTWQGPVVESSCSLSGWKRREGSVQSCPGHILPDPHPLGSGHSHKDPPLKGGKRCSFGFSYSSGCHDQTLNKKQLEGWGFLLAPGLSRESLMAGRYGVRVWGCFPQYGGTGSKESAM